MGDLLRFRVYEYTKLFAGTSILLSQNVGHKDTTQYHFYELRRIIDSVRRVR